jgi:rubredoxin
MEANHSSTRPTREEFRKQFLETAEAVFDLMFGDANQEQLVTLTQREDMACALGKDLSRFLLERHISSDSAAQPKPDRVCCPKCGRTARKVAKTDTSRPVTTLAGDIEFTRQQWRCPRCRILFFSA